MGEAFIVRKGGVTTEQALAPTITEVSTDETEIVFTITNNDTESAVILYEVDDATPDENSVELAAAATSSNIVVTGLTAGTTYTISATASVTGKVLSNVTSLAIETDLFNPADLSPQLWLDASDATTITESSGSVSQWNNKGSLGNFTQATGADQPTTGVTTLNSLNVIDFAADFMNGTNTNEWKFLHDGTSHEIFAVFRYGTSTSDTTRYAILGNSAGSSSSVGMFIDFNLTNAGRAIHVVYRGGVSTTSVNNDSGANSVVPRFAFNIYHVFVDPDNGTAADRSEHRLNNGTAVKNNTQTNAVSASNPSFALQIGKFGNENGTFTGSIAEMIIISGANATSENRTDIVNYLANKWGITV